MSEPNPRWVVRAAGRKAWAQICSPPETGLHLRWVDELDRATKFGGMDMADGSIVLDTAFIAQLTDEGFLFEPWNDADVSLNSIGRTGLAVSFQTTAGECTNATTQDD